MDQEMIVGAAMSELPDLSLPELDPSTEEKPKRSERKKKTNNKGQCIYCVDQMKAMEKWIKHKEKCSVKKTKKSAVAKKPKAQVKRTRKTIEKITDVHTSMTDQ